MHRPHPLLAAAIAGLILPTLLATSSAQAGVVEPLTSVRVASGLTRPVQATFAPGDYTRLFIVEQRIGSTGRVRVLNLKTGVLNAVPFLSVPSVSTFSEQGLLGLAFHPDYQNNRKFYLNLTDSGGTTRIREYLRSAGNPELADTGFTTLLSISQPFSNHNGGWLEFSPNDGYLYIGTGDGGSSCDPSQRAQDITGQLLGKMLRIDVDGTNGAGGNYGIPVSNPFNDGAGGPNSDEIWAYGIRNPWRCAFDRVTGDLYIADVGQNFREEINFEKAFSAGGKNYGWDCMEGNSCSTGSGCNTSACSCGGVGLTGPVQDYVYGGSPFRCSITGGRVYRGCLIPSLAQTYFYADFCSNQIWSILVSNGAATEFAERTTELDPAVGSISSISSFGEDARGEIYICDLNGGEVFKIIPVTPTINEFDFGCNGTVGLADLTLQLNNWGPCDGCLEDLDGDGFVGLADLTLLLNNWG